MKVYPIKPHSEALTDSEISAKDVIVIVEFDENGHVLNASLEPELIIVVHRDPVQRLIIGKIGMFGEEKAFSYEQLGLPDIKKGKLAWQRRCVMRGGIARNVMKSTLGHPPVRNHTQEVNPSGHDMMEQANMN